MRLLVVEDDPDLNRQLVTALSDAAPRSDAGPSPAVDTMTRTLVQALRILYVDGVVADLREREDGQTTTEYAILLGFLAIAIIIALFFLRNVLRDLFSDAASSVSNAPG